MLGQRERLAEIQRSKRETVDWERISLSSLINRALGFLKQRRAGTGERGRIRTCDPCLKRALLYQLSYAPILSK
jgi:hypothetical protein